MCLSPSLIPNPNRGRKDKYAKLVDSVSAYIEVPCGHCTQCVQMRQSSVVQRCQVEQMNNHLFMCTLTYCNEAMPIVTTSTGYDIRYADRRDVTLMMKRLHKSNAFGRDWKYLAVSELGSKGGRPHFHLIFSVQKFPKDTFGDILNLENLMFHAVLNEWRRNVGSTRSPKWQKLLIYKECFRSGKLRRTYDLHYMNDADSLSGNSDVAFYVTKYMFKPSDRAVRLQQALRLNLPEDEYNDVWKLIKPGFTCSPGFGMADVGYVRSCIERSKQSSEFPQFFNPVDGSSFPLSRYYSRKGVLTMEDALYFNDRKTDKDNFYDDSDVRKFEKLKVLQKVIDSHDEFSNLSDELL